MIDVKIPLIEVSRDDLMRKRWLKWTTRIGATVLIIVLLAEASWMKIWCATAFLKLGGYDLFESLIKSFHIIRHFLNM
ncbi:hypothetical protein [Companilactobacillus insicii]|uniref:hypothetical protein n=1 Tax=Companilactobacillus insicii TaxID=1732567 RepID=UPI001B866C3C|nr:hypothetical protein [Companilactobacillus insicii]